MQRPRLAVVTADRANLSPPSTGPNRLAPGDVLGGCTLLSVLGEGGMGAVYRARDSLDREVAIKILTHAHSQGAALRLAREAQVTASLRHPGIVGVHSSGVERGLAFIVYELVEGPTLEACLEELPLSELLPLIIQVADALGFAHARGVVHRDVKAENVLLGADGQPRVADFGLAMVADAERLTLSGDVFGTPLSMAPEQALGERERYGPQTDVWALGVLLYRALTGRYPIVSPSLHELLLAVKKAKFDPPRAIDSTIPRRLEAVCLKALRRDPADRFPDGTAFAEALEDALAPPPAPSLLLPGLLLFGLPVFLVVGAAVGWGLAHARHTAPVEPAVTPPPPVAEKAPPKQSRRAAAKQVCMDALAAEDAHALIEGLRALALEPPASPEDSPELTLGVEALCTRLLDSNPRQATTLISALADTGLRSTDRVSGSKLLAIATLKATTQSLSGEAYWEFVLSACRLDIPLGSPHLRPLVEILPANARPWSKSPRDPWKRYLDQRLALELRSGLRQQHPALLDLVEEANGPIALGPCHWADTASKLALTVKKPSRGEALLEAAKRRDPENPMVEFHGSQFLSKSGAYPEAARRADRAIELFGKRTTLTHGSFTLRGFVTNSMNTLASAGLRERAKARWRELKALSPDAAADQRTNRTWLSDPPEEPGGE